MKECVGGGGGGWEIFNHILVFSFGLNNFKLTFCKSLYSALFYSICFSSYFFTSINSLFSTFLPLVLSEVFA